MASKMKRLGWFSVLLGLALWALFAAILPAQAPEMPATADAVIEQMATAAGVIFAGQVTAVRAPSGFAGLAEGATGGLVEVDFRVDEAVRGPRAGSVYTLREWAGLWSTSGQGSGRYRVGQRLLVFLYGPDGKGLNSPVRGMDGALPLRGGGVAPGPDDSISAAAQWLVDLRWVQAQAVKTDATRGIPWREPVGPWPIRPGPVRPRPISGLENGGRAESSTREVEPALARRLPVLNPQLIAPLETQPLQQVIALCQKAINQQTHDQQTMGHSSLGDAALGGQTMRWTDAVR